MTSHISLVRREAKRLSLAEAMATRNESRGTLLYLAAWPNSAVFSRVRAMLANVRYLALLEAGFCRMLPSLANTRPRRCPECPKCRSAVV